MVNVFIATLVNMIITIPINGECVHRNFGEYDHHYFEYDAHHAQ